MVIWRCATEPEGMGSSLGRAAAAFRCRPKCNNTRVACIGHTLRNTRWSEYGISYHGVLHKHIVVLARITPKFYFLFVKTLMLLLDHDARGPRSPTRDFVCVRRSRVFACAKTVFIGCKCVTRLTNKCVSLIFNTSVDWCVVEV